MKEDNPGLKNIIENNSWRQLVVQDRYTL